MRLITKSLKELVMMAVKHNTLNAILAHIATKHSSPALGDKQDCLLYKGLAW